MKKNHGKMKAQFFLLGTFLLCLLFFLGLPLSSPKLSVASRDLSYLSENIQKELPRALNFGLNSTGGINTLENFTAFVKAAMLEHSVNYTSLWIVTENRTDSNLNVTAANHLGSAVTLSIRVSGSNTTLELENNEINSSVFTMVPDEFEMNISFGSVTKNMVLQRNKVNLYAFIKLQRDENFLQEEIVA